MATQVRSLGHPGKVGISRRTVPRAGRRLERGVWIDTGMVQRPSASVTLPKVMRVFLVEAARMRDGCEVGPGEN